MSHPDPSQDPENVKTQDEGIEEALESLIEEKEVDEGLLI